MRTQQYASHLMDAGFAVQYAPFFEDSYLKRIYAGGSGRATAIRSYLRRIHVLRRAKSPDLVWLEKESFPWWPGWLERLLTGRLTPIITDYDDAIFHRYDHHDQALVRTIFGAKIDRIMAQASLVTAGNGYLAARARRAGARSVEIVPTVVDMQAYQPCRRETTSTKATVIGWIGMPSTWRSHASLLVPLLDSLVEQRVATIRVVGAHFREAKAGYEFCDWSEKTEIELLQNMDIGIMPLPDTPWTRGKCGYKLIQYMACGLPVVASPVGANREIVEHGTNGFLAATDREWHEALTTLAANPDLRKKMGAQGRKKVESWYSLQVQGPRVAAMFRELIELNRVGQK